MRTRWFGLCLAAVLGAALMVEAAERTVVEAIVIRVNDQVVTISDFRERLRQEVMQLESLPPIDEIENFARQLFGAIIDELVLLERARESSLKIEDSEVDRAIDGLREDSELGDDAAFAVALEQSGLTLDELRQRYRKNMLIQRAVQSEVKPSEITQEELKRMYEENLESFKTPPKIVFEQLFFAVDESKSDADQVHRRALGVIDRVSQGADLVAEATLAGVEVQELGAIPVADLRPELLEAVADLAPLQLSQPLRLAGGFQVLRLIERVPEGYLPFEEVEERLRRRKSQMTYQAQTRGLVDRLREDYLVETHDELLAKVLEGLADA